MMTTSTTETTMDTNERLNELDLSFAALIAAVNHNALTSEQKFLIEDLLKEWHHGERMSVLLSDSTVSVERIEQELAK
jgi:hypothetical protein